MNDAYPVQFAVDYPDRDLNRLSSACGCSRRFRS